MLEQRTYIEVYNCIGSMVIGSSVVVLVVYITVGGTGWEESNPVGMVPGGVPVAVCVISMM